MKYSCGCEKNVISLQGFTNWVCSDCGESGLEPNSNVPKLCDKCSKERKVCCYCTKGLFTKRLDTLGNVSYEFYDSNKESKCSISEAIGGGLWIGLKTGDRMLLSKQQVNSILPILVEYINSGRI